jgi:hypothetical protein
MVAGGLIQGRDKFVQGCSGGFLGFGLGLLRLKNSFIASQFQVSSPALYNIQSGTTPNVIKRKIPKKWTQISLLILIMI